MLRDLREIQTVDVLMETQLIRLPALGILTPDN